ncbi:hypothetical protein CROQUDRAFT_653487, partial [Cronartium quercuum f. sp. fusiforme G11]
MKRINRLDSYDLIQALHKRADLVCVVSKWKGRGRNQTIVFYEIDLRLLLTRVDIGLV